MPLLEHRPPWLGGPDSRLLSPDEVATLLGVPRRRVFRLPLQQLRFGPRVIRFRPRDVRELIATGGAAKPKSPN
jgi:hypothetical protein